MRGVLAFAAWAALGGCGARTELTEPAGEVECVPPRYDPNAPFLEQHCGSTCTLLGTSERGEAIRYQCDGLGCQFFVNGAPSCDCTDLDFSNTCGNGVPLCMHRSNFNFARSQSLPCASP